MMGGTKPHGFTIVETMIFIAVSGLLLGAALSLINGKQNETEFHQGIRQIENNLQTEISHVATGYYQNNGDFQCTAPGPSVSISAGSKAQGTNGGAAGCQFIGEVIQFAPSDGSTAGSEYIVYPVAGKQYSNSSLAPITTLAQAAPCAIAGPSSCSSYGGRDGSQKVTLPYGITAATVNGVQAPGMLGFFTITSTSGIANGSGQVNGGGSVDLVPFPGDTLGESTAAAIADIDNLSKYASSSNYNPALGVAICFNSGSTDQSGVITIGAGGNPTTVSLQIQGHLCP